MNEHELSDFASIKELVEFFDTHDMGEYDLSVVQFDCLNFPRFGGHVVKRLEPTRTRRG